MNATNAVVHLRHADVLTGKDLAQIDLAAVNQSVRIGSPWPFSHAADPRARRDTNSAAGTGGVCVPSDTPARLFRDYLYSVTPTLPKITTRTANSIRSTD